MNMKSDLTELGKILKGVPVVRWNEQLLSVFQSHLDEIGKHLPSSVLDGYGRYKKYVMRVS